MTAQTRAVLKTYFQRGLRPTQSNYGDLIDSFSLVGTSAEFVQKTGDTMTGSLILYATPSAAAPDLQAATKIYVDTAVSGVGSPPFADSTAIIKGSSDPTKLLKIEVDGFTAGTTRTLTAPDADGTIATITEGVYTVTITCIGGGTVTLLSTNDSASYERIGNTVRVSGLIIVSSVSTPSGELRISLPFTCVNIAETSGYTTAEIILDGTVSSSGGRCAARVAEATAYIRGYTTTSTGLASALSEQLQAGTEIYFSAIYRAV